MAKQDALDAINATIVENNQKGITAQSLKNVLITMVENAGEGGSGDGSLRVYGLCELPLNSEIIAEVGALDAEYGTNLVTELEEAISKNIVTYNAIKTAITEGKDIPQIVMDTSVYASLITQTQFGAIGLSGVFEKFHMGEVFSMHPIITYFSPSDSGIAQGASEVFEIILKLPSEVLKSGENFMASIMSDEGSGALNIIGGYRLNSDGTIDYKPVGEIYIPEEGYTLTEEQKEINSLTYNSTMLPKDAFRVKVVSDSSSWSNTIYYPLHVSYAATGEIIFFDGTSFKSLTVTEGEPTITVIGTLTVPTETA